MYDTQITSNNYGWGYKPTKRNLEGPILYGKFTYVYLYGIWGQQWANIFAVLIRGKCTPKQLMAITMVGNRDLPPWRIRMYAIFVDPHWPSTKNPINMDPSWDWILKEIEFHNVKW